MNPGESAAPNPGQGQGPPSGGADDVRQALRQLHQQQMQLQAELQATQAALEAERSRSTQPAAGAVAPDQLNALIQALTVKNGSGAAQEATGPRDWKPPTWDGKADTFRDYLLRLKSSYKVRSGLKPTLSTEYFWDSVYNTLPARERARTRHFWEKGDPKNGKDPVAFFTELERIFADSNEQAKAMEKLTNLRHSNGQPWHEHQLIFDELLLSADGERWTDASKIGYLRNTFSNTARMYTASMPKRTEYYDFSEEVERIMTNLEETDQFKTANKRWKENQPKVSGSSTPATGNSSKKSGVARIDADGDTVMTPTQTTGHRNARGGNRGNRGGGSGTTTTKQKAKWVDDKEREKRREKGLCFRCGTDGHRIRDCPYSAATPPTTSVSVNTVRAAPVLEDDGDSSDTDSSESGKE